MNRGMFFLLGALFLILLIPTALADTQIWQGKYLSGSPSTSYTFNFTVYDDLTGGSACYTNTTSLMTNTDRWWKTYQEDVLVSCSNSSIDYYLNININGADQDPRRFLSHLKFATIDGLWSENTTAGTTWLTNTSMSVGIGTSTPDSSAKFEISSDTKGFLPPRMNDTQRDAIASPSTGLILYDTTNDKPDYFNGSVWKAFVSTDVSTFVVGSIPFATGAHHISDDNANLFWDNVNKRLGIGTASPDTALEVFAPSNEQLRLKNSASPTAIADISVDGAGSLLFDLTDGADTGQYFQFKGEDNGLGLLIRDSSGGSNYYANFYMNDDTTDYLNIVINADNSLAGLVIDDDNQIGIGTTSPEEKLHLDDGTFLQTPGNPTIVGTYSNTTYMNDAEHVDVVGKYAYVTALSSDSLTVLDISDPTNPAFVGWLKDTGNLNGATGVQVVGDYAYVSTQNNNSFVIIDVSDPSSPTFQGSVTGMGTPLDLYVSGRYAYVTSSAQDRLYIIDITDPTNPETVGTVTNSTYMNFATGVYVNGKYAYVGGYSSNSLAVVDVSDPTNPSVVGGIINSTYMQSARGVYSDGRYVYVAGYISDSLAIIDISDPTNPTMVGGISSGLNGADSVQVLGDYAYVIEFVSNALSVVDVSDPTSPSIVGTRSGLTGAVGLDVSGKYAYVVSNSVDSLSVLDLGGIDSYAASFGSVSASKVDVENAQVGNDMHVGNGLTVGSGGVYSQGSASFDSFHVSSLEGSYTGGSAYVCVYNNGTLWASESACP